MLVQYPMRKKREKQPKGDALIRPGFAARLRNCAKQTILNALDDGRLRGIRVYDSAEVWDWVIRWRDVRRFAPRTYTRSG